MDDSCVVCADALEWVAYGPCGHREVCSTCVVRLRFMLEDSRCCICKTNCPSVFVTKDYRGKRKDTWFVDSGCSRHMTGDSRWFTSFTRSIGDDFITFGDDKQGRIEGTGSIRVNDSFILKDVALVDKLRKQPLRVYSMVKYTAIAHGDAEIFMKFARAGYKEKIWDHAAGVVIIQEAGVMITDAGGRPLDFSRGVYLEGLDGGIIACSTALLHQRILEAVDASWNSSTL